MVTRKQADRTLAYHQGELLQNPNLVYLSVVSRLDERGRPTKDYCIQAGIIHMNVQKAAAQAVKDKSKAVHEFVPSRLAIPSDVDPGVLTKDFLDVEIVQSGEIKALSFTDRRRPCEGGNSVGNYRPNSAGTLGAPITIEDDKRNLYFLSNWHVLVGGNGRLGDSLIQPGRLDGGSDPGDRIGSLYWHRLDEKLDAAVGKADQRSLLRMGTRCDGDNLVGMERARVGQAVKKCGRTTRGTTGTVQSVNATVTVSGYPEGNRVFDNQIQTTSMLRAGDSGSLLCSINNKVVGLSFAGSDSVSFHNHIGNISSSTSRKYQEKTHDGILIELPRFRIKGFLRNLGGI